MELISWAVMPSILLVGIIYLSDRFKEPLRHVVGAFLLGVGFVIFLYILIEFVHYIFIRSNIIDELTLIYGHGYFTWDQSVWFHFIRASYLEELCKFSVLYLYCMRFKSFNEPYDAIIYGVAISLGFSAIENIDYVTSIEAGHIRIFPTLMHASTGIVMGLLLSKYLIKEKSKILRLFLSFQIPVLMHGLYNLSNYEQFKIVIVIYVIISLFIIMIQRNKQKHKLWEEELMFKHSNVEYLKTISIVLLFTVLICIALSTIY